VESRRILHQVIRLNVYRGTLNTFILPKTHKPFRVEFRIPHHMLNVFVPHSPWQHTRCVRSVEFR
jgi:hypothetical protein